MKIEINLPEEYDARTKAYMENMVNSLTGDTAVTDVDRSALEMFAYCLNNYILARDLLLADGLVLRDKEGIPIKAHPAVKIVHDNEVKMFKLLREFRMTPKGREKLHKEKPSSPFDAFLNGVTETR